MAIAGGSLFKGIQDAIKKNDGKVAVFIIDQPQNARDMQEEVSMLTFCQQQLIRFAVGAGCLFWRIEPDIQGATTLVRLRALLPQNTPVIKKSRANAFDSTGLAGNLKTAGVKYLVLLGHAMNHCVKQTAIGGSFRKNDAFVPGATGNNFEVMTTRSVLSGQGANEEPTWVDAEHVTFYASLQ
jgi:hypothetical protein